MELRYLRKPQLPAEEKNIVELSALVDADSFFYGLWDTGMKLYHADECSLNNFQKESLIRENNCTINKAKFGVVNNLFSLVPSEEFVTESMSDFIVHDCNIKDPKDYIFRNDYSEKFSLRVVYAIRRKLLLFINESFEVPSLVHIATAFLDALRLNTDHNIKLHIQILNEKAIIGVTRASQILLVNIYQVKAPADLLYFMYLIKERFDIDPHTVQVDLSGIVDQGNEEYELISRYFPGIQFIDLKIGMAEDSSPGPHIYHPVYSIAKCV